VLEPVDPDALTAPAASSGVAPLLTELMREYAATGLPPAYLPSPDPHSEEESRP